MKEPTIPSFESPATKVVLLPLEHGFKLRVRN